MVRFHLFARQYVVSYSRLGKLMDFSGSLDPRGKKNFDRVEFTERISDKINMIRFNDI